MLQISDIKKFNWFYRNNYKLLVLYFVVAILEYALSGFVPKLFATISDNLIAGNWTLRELNIHIAIVFFIAIIAYPIRVWREYMAIDMGIFAVKNSIKTIVRKFMKQDLPFFNKFTAGKIVTLSSSDTDTLDKFTSYGQYAISVAVVQTTITIALMVQAVGPILSVLAVLPLPILVMTSFFLSKYWDIYYDIQQQQEDKMNDKVLEDVGGVRVIRAYHAESRKRKSFEERANILRKASLKFALFRALFWPACGIVSLFSYMIAIFLGFRMLASGQVTIGNFMSFFIYIDMLIWPAISLSEFIVVASQAVESMNRIDSMLTYEGSMEAAAQSAGIVNWDLVENSDISVHSHKGQGYTDFNQASSDKVSLESLDEISLKNCSFEYPFMPRVSTDSSEDFSDDFEVDERESLNLDNANFNIDSEELQEKRYEDKFRLEDISLNIVKNKTVGVVGPVGSGKSTLLKLFLRLYPNLEGEMTINNIDVSKVSRRSLRDRIAYVPQSSFLFSTSIQNNILLAKGDDLPKEEVTDERKSQLDEVIVLADLEKDLPQFPKGLMTEAGEKGIALSGGQKQRISIARALFKNKADLLILDDSLSAVDGTTEARILANLRNMQGDRAMLISAHRFSAILNADEILVMDRGKIAARGKHQDLLKCNSWYRDQAYHQSLITEDEYRRLGEMASICCE